MGDMSMRRLYVCDTNSIIFFFSEVFQQQNKLSDRACRIIREGIWAANSDVRLCIPSVVFVEIFEKWLTTEEFLRRFFFEVFVPLKQSENVEIRGIDRETLECLATIDGLLANHEMHDKLVYSAAIALECDIITTDPVIIRHVQQTGSAHGAFG